MKKILFVITKSNWGGAQRYVFDLATNLPKENFDVAVAFGGGDLLKKRLEAANIRSISLAHLQRDISFFAEEKAIKELVALFKKERPDIVHLNSSKVGGLGSLAARVVGVPLIIFTAHGWPFWEQRSFFVKMFIWFFSWLTALFSKKIIVVSDYDLKVAQKMPFIRRKVTRIYNGIDSKFSQELMPGNFVREYFPPGAHITGTIGELNNNKNQIELIEAARKNPNMYVAICGDGENRSFLNKKIEEYNLKNRVKLFGFVEPRMVLKGFDTFALPSLKEGLPYVLLEAKAAGLPIVANRVGGVGEILDQDISEFSLEKMVEKTIAVYNY